MEWYIAIQNGPSSQASHQPTLPFPSHPFIPTHPSPPHPPGTLPPPPQRGAYEKEKKPTATTTTQRREDYEHPDPNAPYVRPCVCPRRMNADERKKSTGGERNGTDTGSRPTKSIDMRKTKKKKIRRVIEQRGVAHTRSCHSWVG